MRFTAALRQFIAPSKHKMPGREACMRVGTPPLHFYRRLPVKPGNIPPISCSRERSPYDHFKSALSFPPNAVTDTPLLFLLHLPAKFMPFVIPWILFGHIVTNLGEISFYRISIALRSFSPENRDTTLDKSDINIYINRLTVIKKLFKYLN